MGKQTKKLIITCPNCEEFIIIEKLNCCIFRHAVYKKTNKQIGPHTSHEKCEKLIKDNLIFGCGKPFKIIVDKNKITTVTCDYI